MPQLRVLDEPQDSCARNNLATVNDHSCEPFSPCEADGLTREENSDLPTGNDPLRDGFGPFFRSECSNARVDGENGSSINLDART
jgi:hypothetical protein